MSHLGVNPTKVHVWSITKGPVGDCNTVMADRENLTLFLKQLEGGESADEALRDVATDIGFNDDNLRCLDQNYFDGAYWPDFPDYAGELREASIDGMHRALDGDKRLVSVVTQIPGLDRPWVAVVELFTEVLIQSFLPAAPLDPT